MIELQNVSKYYVSKEAGEKAAVRNINLKIECGELFVLVGWDLSTEGPRTFNGMILEHLEEIPAEGVVCEIEGLLITILEVSDNMVKQAKVVRKGSSPQEKIRT